LSAEAAHDEHLLHSLAHGHAAEVGGGPSPSARTLREGMAVSEASGQSLLAAAGQILVATHNVSIRDVGADRKDWADAGFVSS
jgi:hypothetical protein